MFSIVMIFFWKGLARAAFADPWLPLAMHSVKAAEIEETSRTTGETTWNEEEGSCSNETHPLHRSLARTLVRSFVREGLRRACAIFNPIRGLLPVPLSPHLSPTPRDTRASVGARSASPNKIVSSSFSPSGVFLLAFPLSPPMLLVLGSSPGFPPWRAGWQPTSAERGRIARKTSGWKRAGSCKRASKRASPRADNTQRLPTTTITTTTATTNTITTTTTNRREPTVSARWIRRTRHGTARQTKG